jgi:hypothetical protein
VADKYVKVSFAQYLLELDFSREVDDSSCRAAAKDGNLILKLKKVGQGGLDEVLSSALRDGYTCCTLQAEPGLWSELVIKADKAVLRARRQQAVEDKREREQKVCVDCVYVCAHLCAVFCYGHGLQGVGRVYVTGLCARQLLEAAKDRRIEVERMTLRAQMAMEQAERQNIEELKAEEKRRAEVGGREGGRHDTAEGVTPDGCL